MNEQQCGQVRELIPDFAAGRLSGSDPDVVERHVAACAECAAELALVRVLLEGIPAVPEGLVTQLLTRVASPGVQPTRAWWGVSAAAVAALALGIGMSSNPSVPAPTDVPGFAYEVEEGDIWVSDDGLLAGAPLFDGLSDDALLQLLDELAVGSAGGSA